MSSASDPWPYDADPGHPLVQLRIPVITTLYPRWYYSVALMVATHRNALWPSLEPTEEEGRKIAAYLEFRLQGFGEDWRRKLRERPFDMEKVSVILRKCPDGGWRWRQSTWRDGPEMEPSDGSILSLDQLLDRITKRQAESWESWKASRPDAFATAGES